MKVVVLTHKMGFARDVADRVLFLDALLAVEQGAPDDGVTRPKPTRTQDFLRRILPS